MVPKRRYSPVAQSVEQVAVNHWVGGSSPSRGANQIKDFKEIQKSHKNPGAAVQQVIFEFFILGHGLESRRFSQRCAHLSQSATMQYQLIM